MLLPLTAVLYCGLNQPSAMGHPSLVNDLIPSDTSKNPYGETKAKYHGYQGVYALDSSYTAEGKREIARKDSIRRREIIVDMQKDHIISNDDTMSFRLSDTKFLVNGQLQPEAIFLRYKAKYVPTNGKNWVWSYSANQAVTNSK